MAVLELDRDIVLKDVESVKISEFRGRDKGSIWGYPFNSIYEFSI